MRIPHLARLVFALLFAACLVAPALAEDEQEPTDVARQLLLEGRHEEAAAALEKHRGHGHMEPVELAVLDGLIAQQRESHAEAVWQFRHALDLQPERVSVHLYLAQCLFALDQLEACYEHLRAGEGAGENLPAYFVLRARVEQALAAAPNVGDFWMWKGLLQFRTCALCESIPATTERI